MALGLDDDLADEFARRPKTRADCVDGPRPCPWAGCRHHLGVEVNPDTGSLKHVFGDVPIEDVEHTCSLDVADLGGATLEDVAAATGLTRERVREIETIGLERMRAAGAELGNDGDGEKTAAC